MKTNSVFETTTTETFTITLVATDSLGLSSSETITITVDPSTSTPTDITLSNDTVTAYRPIGTLVGLLSSSDPNVWHDHQLHADRSERRACSPSTARAT